MMLRITPAERAALQLLATGSAEHEISTLLGASEDTLEACLATLFSRLGVASRKEAVSEAFRRGLLTPPADGVFA
jgi:LuxR family quorum sensing-dependent transcriptional regulator